jgi:hypothetical protein
MIFPSPAKFRMSEQGAGHKSLLLLFFRKDDASFSEEKEAQRLLFLVLRRAA